MDWFEKSYSRLLVDNHITDQKKKFMSKFTPEEYVRLAVLSGVEAATVYTCDHNGNCYYPTKVGHVHANIGGRDLFGEVIAGLRKEGILPVAYYTATYHNDCAERYPETVIRDNEGHTHDGRYHFTCPNQPDAENFYKAQIAEILAYDVDGLFIDMSFWPSICCCQACRSAFGKPFPEIIDWANPDWVEFQRFRENSMAAFAQRLTDFARQCKPGIPVAHQFSPVLHGWYLGQSDGIAAASDYASGDFYGSKLQHRFAAKAFEAFSRRMPFEFSTSRCVDLHDHTSGKSEDELFISALTTLANGGAYHFIDAINPDGTQETAFYELMGKLNLQLKPFRDVVKQMRAVPQAEVGVYFSMPSCVDRSINGIKLFEFGGGCANNMEVRHNTVQDEVMGTAEILNKMHIPFKILTESKTDYTPYRVIIINRASYLSEEEINRLREFVRNGGTLLATGDTSLYDLQGKSTGNFALADVLGVNFTGTYSDKITYTGKNKILAEGEVPLVKPAGAEIIEYLTFPDFPANDPDHYASIHSNPPGEESSYPALTVHSFGKGKAYWLAAPIFILRQYTQQEYGKKLFERFLPSFLLPGSNLPGNVEVTLLKNAADTEHLLCLVNWQNEFPVLPLFDITLHINYTGKITRITDVETGENMEFTCDQNTLTLKIDRIDSGKFYHIV